MLHNNETTPANNSLLQKLTFHLFSFQFPCKLQATAKIHDQIACYLFLPFQCLFEPQFNQQILKGN